MGLSYAQKWPCSTSRVSFLPQARAPAISSMVLSVKGRDQGSIQVLHSLMGMAAFLLMKFCLIPLLCGMNLLQRKVLDHQTGKPLSRQQFKEEQLPAE